jgi:serine/threonine protein kinase
VDPEDQLFGETALFLGAISSTQLEYSKTVQAAWRSEGTALPLCNVLQHLGYIQMSAISHIQQEVTRRRPKTSVQALPPNIPPAPRATSSSAPFSSLAAPVPPAMPGQGLPGEDLFAPPDPNPMVAWGNLSDEFDLAPADPGESCQKDWDANLETSGEVEAHIFQTWSKSDRGEVKEKPRAAKKRAEVKKQRPRPLTLESRLIGSQLGQYRIEEKIGEGGRGLVFRATQESMGRSVAIKVLSEAVAADPVNLKRFLQEAKAAGKMTHRFIVGAIDYGQEEGLHYMVMPYIKGQTCEQHIKATKKSGYGFVLKIALQMAEALVAIEDAGIIHRDIKPANIIIREDGDVCLMDLGLVKTMNVEHTLTAIGNTVGTPDYMSPEQCLGRKLSIKTDVYALGATLFHILTGKTPYKADSPLKLMKKQVKDPVPSAKEQRPETPSPIAKLLKAMMSKNPAKRPKPSMIVEYCQRILDKAMNNTATTAKKTNAASPKKNKKASAKAAHSKKRRKSERTPNIQDDLGQQRQLNTNSERRVARPRRRRRGGSDNTMLIAVALLFVVVVGVAAIFLLLSQQSA